MLKRKWAGDAETQGYSEPDLQGEFISLPDIAAFIRRYAISVAVAVAVGIAVAAAYVATTDPIYSARTRVLIQPKLPQLLQQTQPAEVNLSLDTAQIESQIAVLQSEKIATMVIDELGLRDDRSFNRPTSRPLGERMSILWGELKAALGLSALLPAATPEWEEPPVPPTEFERERRTMDIFQRGLSVYRVGVSYAVEISFSSRNAELAAKIANSTADAFVREQLETRNAAATDGLNWLEVRIDQLRAQMNTATQAVQAFRVKHDYRVEDAGGAAAEPEPEGPTLEELEVTAETYRKMYESFLQAFTSSVNQEPYLVADTRVITSATRPLGPSQPRRKLILAFGAVAGLTLGLGLAFARHLMDGSIRSARQVREELGTECLGELPSVLGRRGGFGRLDEVCRAPGSTYAHAIKAVQTAILMADLDRPVRLIGITSASPGEGKSTLASNVAARWAASGVRTLVIDADTDNRALSKAFLPDEPGTPMREGGGLIEQMRRRIAFVPDLGFDLLPAAFVEAQGLTDPKTIQALLGGLDSYEFVVVDLPPLTAGADWLPAASQLDGVVVAVHAARTPSDFVHELVRALHVVKASVLGVVLTRVHNPSIQRLRRGARKSAR